MAKFRIEINSILGGMAQSPLFMREGQYQTGYNIDPDRSVDGTVVSTSQPAGFIWPGAYAKISASTYTGYPLWMIPNPKDTNTYVYASDGKISTISSSFVFADLNSGTALSASSGNGGAYYDNYIYFRKNADVARYGPLNGSASLVQNYWTSTLSLAAPTNTTYPSLGHGPALPNGVMHRHTDNKLYFADVVGNKGYLHYISTSKTTVEGDTNNGSTYQAIDFPLGYYPTCIESYGTDLVIGLIEATSSGFGNRGRAAKIAFWDTTSSSFQKITDVELPDPYITALKNVNGVLYAFTGTLNSMRILSFVGGYSYQEVDRQPIQPPFQGAVDQALYRLYFGSGINYPSYYPGLFALGSKFAPLQGTHPVGVPSDADSVITSVLWQQKDGEEPLIGWGDGTNYGIDRNTRTTYQPALFRSEQFKLGKPFRLSKFEFPLTDAVAANFTLIPTIYTNGGNSSTALRTINSTNYPNSEKKITHYQDVVGDTDFFLALAFSGTAGNGVGFPIVIEGETYDNT